MNSQEFYNELKQLTELGYLEQEQLYRIRNEYLKTRKEKRGIFLIFALLGVIFMGAGIISLFAYNWSMFSREAKALIAFLPLMGIQGTLYWKTRTNASDTWIKSLTLALGIAFLSALGLIYQAYQISYSLISMMLTGFLFMLPVVYLLDGYYLAVLYMTGICWAGGNNDYILLVLLLVPYYRNRIKGGENCGLLSLCFFIWLLYLAILYAPYESFYACILILMIYMTIKTPAIYSRLAGRLLYILLFFKAVFYEFFTSLADFFSLGAQDWYLYRLPGILIAGLLAAVGIRMFIYHRKSTKSQWFSLILSGIMCGLLTADLILFQETDVYIHSYEVLVNFFFIAYSLYKLLYGFKLADLSSVRRYTAAIILYIVFKVCFGNYHLLVKGVVFLVAGLAFLIANYRMTIKMKGGNSHENVSD